MAEAKVKVIETALRMIKNKTILVPIPDILMITQETSKYIIKRLAMIPVAYIEVPQLPPRMIAIGGAVFPQLSIYASLDNPLFIVKIPSIFRKEEREALPALSEALISWCERNEFERLVILDVSPASEEKLPSVRYAAEERLIKEMEKLGFKPISGMISTLASSFLNQCIKSRIDGVLLEVESKVYGKVADVYQEYLLEGMKPEIYRKLALAVKDFDQDAVKLAIEAVSKVSGVEIPLDKLDEHLEVVKESFKEFFTNVMRFFKGGGPFIA